SSGFRSTRSWRRWPEYSCNQSTQVAVFINGPSVSCRDAREAATQSSQPFIDVRGGNGAVFKDQSHLRPRGVVARQTVESDFRFLCKLREDALGACAARAQHCVCASQLRATDLTREQSPPRIERKERRVRCANTEVISRRRRARPGRGDPPPHGAHPNRRADARAPFVQNLLAL